MKYSRQREALLKLLRSTDSHPTADWLYQRLKEEYPNISLGTVYRNLGVLSDSGEILALHITPEREYFDGFTDEHYHLVCDKCGAVIDVRLPDAENRFDEVEQLTGAKVERQNVVFYGLCSRCK